MLTGLAWCWPYGARGRGVVGSFCKAKNKITPLPSPLLHVVRYSRRGRDSPKTREETQELPRDINLDLSSRLGEFEQITGPAPAATLSPLAVQESMTNGLVLFEIFPLPPMTKKLKKINKTKQVPASNDFRSQVLKKNNPLGAVDTAVFTKLKYVPVVFCLDDMRNLFDEKRAREKKSCRPTLEKYRWRLIFFFRRHLPRNSEPLGNVCTLLQIHAH